jgi:hypothetical protein
VGPPGRHASGSQRDEVACAFCGEQILASAKKCRHCGEWLSSREGVVAAGVLRTDSTGRPTAQPSSTWWSRRSWAGKTLIVVVASVLGLAVVASLVPSEETDNEASPTPVARDDSPQQDAAVNRGAPSQGNKAAQVGDRVSLKGTSYEVLSAETKVAVGGEFTRVEADGIFVVIHLTLTNEKDDPRTILADAVRLVGGNGKQYSTDSEACLAFENSLCLLQEIQPDLPKKVVAVYDVPPTVVSGARLEVHDLFSDETGQIDLRL